MDLDQAFHFLSEKSPNSARKAITSILERVSQLENFPESGPEESSLSHRKKTHRYLVSDHHKIIYRIEKQAVLIIRVFDTRQNPKKLK